MNENKLPRVFELGLKDVISIYQEQLVLPLGVGSYFYNRLRVGEQESLQASGANVDRSVESDWKPVDVYTLEPDFIKALKCVASPEAFITLKVGGGDSGLDTLQIHHHKSMVDGYITIVESGVDVFSILMFDTISEVVVWVVDTLGCKHMEPMPNFMPPQIMLEEFLFLLHAIDTFRRKAYMNLIAHKVEEKVMFTYAEFMADMSASIASGDIRWLLPCFVMIAPGAVDYELNLTYEHANKLFRLGFLELAEKTATGEEQVVFGEAGLITGVEFYRTWLMGIGIEAKVIRDNQVHTLERLFIAPTAVANHLVRMEYGDGGQIYINHQTYTKEQLETKLIELFSNLRVS